MQLDNELMANGSFMKIPLSAFLQVGPFIQSFVSWDTASRMTKQKKSDPFMIGVCASGTLQGVSPLRECARDVGA